MKGVLGAGTRGTINTDTMEFVVTSVPLSPRLMAVNLETGDIRYIQVTNMTEIQSMHYDPTFKALLAIGCTTTQCGTVAAIDPQTGKTLWVLARRNTTDSFRPSSLKPSLQPFKALDTIQILTRFQL